MPRFQAARRDNFDKSRIAIRAKLASPLTVQQQCQSGKNFIQSLCQLIYTAPRQMFGLFPHQEAIFCPARMPNS
jgi:hypothetical protein